MPPAKRARPPKITTQALLEFDLGESSSDSDFRIEDHEDGSLGGGEGNSSDSSSSSTSNSDSDDDSEEAESDDSTLQLKQLLEEEAVGGEALVNGINGDSLDVKLKEFADKSDQLYLSVMKPMCCVCLGERSDDSNEIIECDGCGVSVHEGCYGVSDNMSISSTNSTCSTEPWFCEACRAGVSEPTCELCPNKGGIYKETDVGKWVHLICALYVPGVAFGEVEQLSSVTLFEMQYNKWGAKVCSLCENSLFARTGVCIGCDAGMCKTYFHVTCAQTAGFLIEAHHEDADAADPFYAHCKVHSEKEMIRKRKRNYQTLRLNMQKKARERLTLKLDDPSPAQMRIHRKLLKIQGKYSLQKQLKPEPWVPTQKMSRLLTTSASACKRLLAKAAVMSVDVELMERQEAQIAALTDIRKKWHIAPAFSVEFVAYYLDRISRIGDIRQQINEMVKTNSRLTKQQDELRTEYDDALDELKVQKAEHESLISAITTIHKTISILNPNKVLPNPETIGRPQPEPPRPTTPPQRPISVPTAAALKMGVGFPLAHLGPPGTKVDSTRMLSTHAKNSPHSGSTASPAPPTTPTLYSCGICKLCSDQQLLAKCDTCNLHYHLGCLNPPLARHPKKSKQYGWQCSGCCDKSDVSDAVVEAVHGRRKSRTRYSHDGIIVRDTGRDSVLGKRLSLDNAPLSVFVNSSPTRKVVKKEIPDDIYISSGCDEKPETNQVMSNAAIAQLPQKTPVSTPQPIVPKTEPLEPAIPASIVSGIVDVTDAISDPLALPIAINANANASLSALDDSFDSSSRLSRKQKRKEKHKNKHNSSSDTEKSPNKEHKRKRKKKHEEQMPEVLAGCIPKIKIKFKTLPLPGEDTPEAQFFYVSADAVRSAEEASRPTSVETVEEIATIEPPAATLPVAAPAVIPFVPPNVIPFVPPNVIPFVQPNAMPFVPPNVLPFVPTNVIPFVPSNVIPFVLPTEPPMSDVEVCKPPESMLNTSPSVARKVSPRKASPRKPKLGRPKSVMGTKIVEINCCVCTEPGKSNQVVTCDICRKHYHFTCLDPPLKKSPKIRGYSWHCADCDPTDDERK